LVLKYDIWQPCAHSRQTIIRFVYANYSVPFRSPRHDIKLSGKKITGKKIHWKKNSMEKLFTGKKSLEKNHWKKFTGKTDHWKNCSLEKIHAAQIAVKNLPPGVDLLKNILIIAKPL
jgi:hypothetical protein